MEILPFVSFFTGIISILSPCILPIIPIFVGVSLNSKSKMEIFSFICGLLSVFVVVILLTGFFTSIVYQYLFYFRIFSVMILLVIGILMLFDFSFNFKSLSVKNKEGIIGSFVLGFLTSIAWAPCYSAYLISLISLLVSSSDVGYAIFNIILYVLGFALTLFILSLFISKINLERLISKTRHIPKIFAVLVIFGALYLLYDAIQAVI